MKKEERGVTGVSIENIHFLFLSSTNPTSDHVEGIREASAPPFTLTSFSISTSLPVV